MVICMKKKKKIKVEENISFDSSEIKKVVIIGVLLTILLIIGSVVGLNLNKKNQEN